MSASNGVTLLVSRCASICTSYGLVDDCDFPQIDWQHWKTRRIILTGIGMSEGVARAAASLWLQAGLCARFVPATAMLREDVSTLGDVLVVFSQGLSSNMSLVLEAAHLFEDGLFVTSTALDRAELAPWHRLGFHSVKLPPDDGESGLLLRVVGPSLTLYGVMHLTQQMHQTLGLKPFHWTSELELASEVKRNFELSREVSAHDARQISEHGVILVGIGQEVELFHGLRWKLLEGLWLDVPPALDMLQMIHGPWQGCYTSPKHFIVCHHGKDYELALIERFRSLMKPNHSVTTIHSPLDSPWDLFVYDAYLNGLICAHVEHVCPDLMCWPGFGEDDPLYGIASRRTLGLPALMTVSDD